MTNNSLHYQTVDYIYRHTINIFDSEDHLLILLTKKHNLGLSPNDLEKRNKITKAITSYIDEFLSYEEKHYQEISSRLNNEQYEIFLSPEGVPHYIKFLLSIGFPFEAEYLDKENFYQLISEIKQTPDFIEYENKRKDFIENFIRSMENYLKDYYHKRYFTQQNKKIRSEFL